LGIGEPTVGVDEGRSFGKRLHARVGEELVGQRFETGFAGNRALGAAPGLVRQVQVFQLLLGRCGFDGGTQLGRQLTLLVEALQHRSAALLKLAKVVQAHLQLAQLDVVEALGGFLAVAGDEGHRGAAIKQFNGSIDLGWPNLQLSGNLQNDLVQEFEAEKAKRRSLRSYP
jgi:hypothetical protein